MPGSQGGQPHNLPPEVDTTKASVARVYDALLGGKDNFEVDRAVYRAVVEADPLAPGAAQAIRKWLIRAVQWLTDQAGMDQFLDCGAGLPTRENTHESAQRINPDVRVVYVDNDPTVIAHGRVLLEDNHNTFFIPGDLSQPRDLFPEVRRHLDLNKPYVLMQCNTLHHLMDEEKPREIMASYIDALPSGSYVAMCHFYDPGDEDPELSAFAKDMERRLSGSSMASGRFRARDEIASYLDGLELVEPGLVKLHEWWPVGPRITPLSKMDHSFLAGVARKP